MAKAWAIISVGIFVLFLICAFLYMSLTKPKYDSSYYNNPLMNPAESLSIDEAKEAFDENFIYYFLFNTGAYNLHNPPLSSDTPKIEIFVDEEVYSAVVDDGKILVAKRAIDNPDIRILTTLEEAAKMVKYNDYVLTSLSGGKTSIELVASKTLLFSKGYLNFYTEMTGKSITGNIVRIYTS